VGVRDGVREWVHTKQHGRRLQRHRLMLEAHDTAIENALLLGERSQLETRLNGLMTDALREAFGDDYPQSDTPLQDDTLTTLFSAELHAVDGPDDLDWDQT
jgi:hypothetical protein